MWKACKLDTFEWDSIQFIVESLKCSQRLHLNSKFIVWLSITNHYRQISWWVFVLPLSLIIFYLDFKQKNNIEERIGIFWSSSQWLFIQLSTSSTYWARNQCFFSSLKPQLNHKETSMIFILNTNDFHFSTNFLEWISPLMMKIISACFSFPFI